MFVLGWTIGCSVEVKIHEYLEGTASQVKPPSPPQILFIQVLVCMLIKSVDNPPPLPLFHPQIFTSSGMSAYQSVHNQYTFCP